MSTYGILSNHVQEVVDEAEASAPERHHNDEECDRVSDKSQGVTGWYNGMEWYGAKLIPGHMWTSYDVVAVRNPNIP